MKPSNQSSNSKVNAFLADIESLPNEHCEIVRALRALFLKANAAVVEDIKYGGLTFSLSSNLVGGIFVYKKHISVEFSNGAKFADADGMLEGGGKHRRHLKIFTQADVSEKNSAYYIKQAVRN